LPNYAKAQGKPTGIKRGGIKAQGGELGVRRQGITKNVMLTALH